MTKKFVPTKKQAEQIHARRRAKERYDVDLNKDARRQIVGQIQQSLENIDLSKQSCSAVSAVMPTAATFLAKQSNRVTEWEVPYEGQELRVLYDGKRKTLITCLPPLEKDEDNE
jgi:hypothetical protein